MTISPEKYRLMGVIFFISLALNVFAAAYYFGDGKLMRHGRHGSFGGGFSRQLDQLAEPARSEVKATLDIYRPKLKEQMQKVREARESIGETLKDPNYSRQKLNALFNRVERESDKLRALTQQMTLEIADQLSPEERAKFFNRSFGDWKGRGDRKDKREKSALPKQKNALLAD